MTCPHCGADDSSQDEAGAEVCLSCGKIIKEPEEEE